MVEAIVVADKEFLEHISDKYDEVLNLTDVKHPTTGDSYYSETKMFVSNTITGHHDIKYDLNAPHLRGGKNETFEQFKISKYTVKHENRTVYIGCKSYPAAGLMDTLHKLLIEKYKVTTYFLATKDGPSHGKFGVSWEDAEKIYKALKGIKLV